ncbi:hypothetical protein [Streptomyces sp. Y7]|uniref:hypothetical protein n=1 Tax=Streptomyces sp. Y7 TaxID=3342392 RepID=UPI00371D03AF
MPVPPALPTRLAKPTAHRPFTAPASGQLRPEPNTPNGPEVGPPFTKANNVWQADTTTPTLRNTVTARSGHKTTATFEVHTTDSAGKPTATVVKLTDENEWGVLVSGEVTAGKPASVTVPAGKLKNGVTYAVRSSGYDATSDVYENDWSPYSTFKINVPPAEKPYVTFPAPQATSGIDSLAQTPIEFTRTDPGPITGLRGEGSDRKCSAPDAEGRKLCIEITRDAPSPEDAAVAKRAIADRPSYPRPYGAHPPQRHTARRHDTRLRPGRRRFADACGTKRAEPRRHLAAVAHAARRTPHAARRTPHAGPRTQPALRPGNVHGGRLGVERAVQLRVDLVSGRLEQSRWLQHRAAF